MIVTIGQVISRDPRLSWDIPSFEGCTEARCRCHRPRQKSSQQHCLPRICLEASSLSLISCGKHATSPPNSSELQICIGQHLCPAPWNLSSMGLAGTCREPYLASFLVLRDHREPGHRKRGWQSVTSQEKLSPTSSTSERHESAVLLQQSPLDTLPVAHEPQVLSPAGCLLQSPEWVTCLAPKVEGQGTRMIHPLNHLCRGSWACGQVCLGRVGVYCPGHAEDSTGRGGGNKPAKPSDLAVTFS